MVAKCANPECSEQFVRLQQGKLFRSDGVNVWWNGTGCCTSETRRPKKVEFFWLCADCTREMTLVFNCGGEVTIRTIANKNRPAREEAAAPG